MHWLLPASLSLQPESPATLICPVPGGPRLANLLFSLTLGDASSAAKGHMTQLATHPSREGIWNGPCSGHWSPLSPDTQTLRAFSQGQDRHRRESCLEHLEALAVPRP